MSTIEYDTVQVNVIGQQGPRGATWLSGESDPDSELGADGDHYLQTGLGATGATGEVWLKSSGSWAIIGNLMGPAGQQGLLGHHGSAWLDKKLQAYFASPTGFVGVATYGDSVSPHIGQQLFGLMEEFTIPKGGFAAGAGYSTAAAFVDFGVYKASSGTIVDYGSLPVDQGVMSGDPTKADFAYMPSGDHVALSNGATITMWWAEANGFSSFAVYLVSGPGMGTATVELLDKDNADTVVDSDSVDLSDTAIGVAKVTFAAPNIGGKYKIRVSAAGSVVFLRAAPLYTHGLLRLHLGRGGSTLAQNNYSDDGILEFFRSDMNLAAIFVQAKEEDPEANAGPAIERLTALDDLSVICFGNGLPDMSADDAPGIAAFRATNAVFRDACDANGALFIDVFEIFQSYSNLTHLGWQGDGTHPAAGANIFAARMVATMLGILLFQGRVVRQNLENAAVRTGSLYLKDGRAASNDYYQVFKAYGAADPDAFHLQYIRRLFLNGAEGAAPYIQESGGSVAARAADGSPANLNFGNVSATAVANNTFAGPIIAQYTPGLFLGSTSGPFIRTGTGSPEGVVSAPVGSIYLRSNGSAGATLYVKESGSGNTGWRPSNRGGITARGDAAATLTVSDKPTQIWNVPLTADRAVTLPSSGALEGDRFRIVRSAAATGAFNLNVGTGPLKALASAGSWAVVEYDGSAWVLTGYGAL